MRTRKEERSERAFWLDSCWPGEEEYPYPLLPVPTLLVALAAARPMAIVASAADDSLFCLSFEVRLDALCCLRKGRLGDSTLLGI